MRTKQPTKSSSDTLDRAPQQQESEREDREYVMALEKGLTIIEAFGQIRGAATLTRLAEVTGHSKASVRRSLHTLCRLGYAVQRGRDFQLASRTLRLGQAFVVSDALARMALPFLESISERTHESASVAVLDSQNVVFVARATHRRSLSAGLGVGTCLPAYASATGRVLLAGQPREWVEFMLGRMARPALTVHTLTALPDILQQIDLAERQGYALCDQELEMGLRSIAVPIRCGRGELVAAMSLAVATSRISMDAIVRDLLPELETARQKFSALL